jgi:hypothetical protein
MRFAVGQPYREPAAISLTAKQALALDGRIDSSAIETPSVRDGKFHAQPIARNRRLNRFEWKHFTPAHQRPQSSPPRILIRVYSRGFAAQCFSAFTYISPIINTPPFQVTHSVLP